MIFGAHAIVHGRDAEAGRAFLRDVLGVQSVDAGHGGLIFALPPAEAAAHPADDNDRHELTLMCDDLARDMQALAAKGVACSPVQEARRGAITTLAPPGGGALGLYQPPHPMAIAGPAA